MNQPKRNISGIELDDSPVQVMKTTMKLTRDMGMAQKRKKSWGKPSAGQLPPKKAGPKYSIALENSVACPNCEMEFEIVPEYYKFAKKRLDKDLYRIKK